jgi:16S rRNA (guanine527-N7)-methyltransferase
VKRIEELLAEHDLPAADGERFAALLRVLSEDPTAPTTITDPSRAVDAHLADALDALAIPALKSAQRVGDIGAGAGIPGLPLAIALPDATVSLIESAGKKCEFITRAAAFARIANAAAVHSRAEEWAGGVGACDVVTARALAPLNVLIEYAAPLLVDGGALVAWKGRPDESEQVDADAAARELGLELHQVLRQSPRVGATNRSLYVYLKVRATPERFPRRAGMARKRPITALFE